MPMMAISAARTLMTATRQHHHVHIQGGAATTVRLLQRPPLPTLQAFNGTAGGFAAFELAQATNTKKIF
jgi:hypothetical protein